MQKSLPLLEVSGSPNERGYKIGSQYKDLIRKEVNDLFKFMKFTPLSPSREKCLKLTAKYVPYTEDYAPELIEETKGIAEGVGLTFEEIFFLNTYLDVPAVALRRSVWSAKFFGCTAFATSGKATANVEFFIGQNYDLPAISQDFPIIIKNKPKSGPISLIYTLVGIVGFAGLNSKGISLAINKLSCSDAGIGVPYPFVARKILEQETIVNASRAITNAHRASGMNYLIGNSNGDFIDYETTARECEVIYPIEDYIAHANHYLTERLKPLQKYKSPGSSIIRYYRATKLLKARYSEITLEYLKKLTKDHIGYPDSICRHPVEKDPKWKQVKTTSSLIMQPKKRKMWGTLGNPCQNEFVEHIF